MLFMIADGVSGVENPASKGDELLSQKGSLSLPKSDAKNCSIGDASPFVALMIVGPLVHRTLAVPSCQSPGGRPQIGPA